MIILAIESSSRIRSVAVVERSAAGGAGEVLGTVSDGGNRDLTTIRLIEEAIRSSGVARRSIDRIAVALGPGSYTGIRAAIALVQGWHLAQPVQLVGVGTGECLAAQARALGWHGRLAVVLDAQRGQCYHAVYEVDALACVLKVPLAIREPGVDPVEAGRVDLHVGPDVQKFFSLGKTLVPEAGTLGKLAAECPEVVSPGGLTPIYLRETAFVKAPPPRVLSL